MKKLILLVTLMSLFSFRLDAQDKVYLYLKDHSRIEISVGDKLKLSYKNNCVYIKSTLFEWEYSLSEFDKMSFTENGNELDALEADRNSICVRNNEIVFSGFAASSKVSVYTLSGQIHATYATDATGCLTVAFDSYPSGTYLFTIDGFSYKLIKK